MPQDAMHDSCRPRGFTAWCRDAIIGEMPSDGPDRRTAKRLGEDAAHDWPGYVIDRIGAAAVVSPVVAIQRPAAGQEPAGLHTGELAPDRALADLLPLDFGREGFRGT